MATGQAGTRRGACDVVCLSHLRWDFVWQRPQHLMSRCARERRVFFVEEPMRGYTPMALRATERLSPRAVVYDCMEELSAFLDAPRELVDREAKLLERADLDLMLVGGAALSARLRVSSQEPPFRRPQSNRSRATTTS